MNLVEMETRTEWRAWLSANHDKVTEAWLVYFKEGSGKSGVDYESSVEEALCFGWVDSIIKKLDETKYARKFTPRKNDSKWSVSNKERVLKLIDSGLMAESGLEKVEAARRNGSWDNPVSKPVFDLSMPAEFEKALQENLIAKAQFEKMQVSHRKEYLLWIVTAKRPETRERRVTEAIRMLCEGKKLGLR
jgi:uncharacterized protein YdeI (YjbR/CyaY-like superfamily)